MYKNSFTRSFCDLTQDDLFQNLLYDLIIKKIIKTKVTKFVISPFILINFVECHSNMLHWRKYYMITILCLYQFVEAEDGINRIILLGSSRCSGIVLDCRCDDCRFNLNSGKWLFSLLVDKAVPLVPPPTLTYLHSISHTQHGRQREAVKWGIEMF